MTVHAWPLVALVLLLCSSVLAQSRPIVVVFAVEAKRVGLPAEALEGMADYLGTLMARRVFQVVPRSQIKERLTEVKKGSYRECYDESCQIEIGKELDAEKSLSTRILKVGTICMVTSQLYDLKSSTAEKTASVRATACSAESLVEAIDAVARQLGAR